VDFATYIKKHLISDLLYEYRIHLSKSLAKTYQYLNEIQKDDRLKDLVEEIPKRNLLNEEDKENIDVSEINIQNIDNLSKQSFPLCMEVIHSTLKKKKDPSSQTSRPNAI